jgi:hypothetical protein
MTHPLAEPAAGAKVTPAGREVAAPGAKIGTASHDPTTAQRRRESHETTLYEPSTWQPDPGEAARIASTGAR